ncbi:unnamed protein product [Phaeothamnion confervicola]
MSNIYHTEPPTSGKVVLRTSHGEIDIELWAKEAPRACRNFVQLALEGYYDNTIFHRVLPKVLVQGGDPTGTGRGGESVYGKPFRDEVHTRIKFNHRGQVAMANENEPNTNHSQFFLTLDRADWLDKKHTIFGKVTGSTIFNALRMGDCEVDAEDRPLDPPLLLGVDVLVNPFDDIVPRAAKLAAALEKEAAAAAAGEDGEKKGGARKGKGKGKGNGANRAGKKDFKVLSFGDEAEEEEKALVEAAPSGGGGGMRSAHDVLEDERLLQEKAYDIEDGGGGGGGGRRGGGGGRGSSSSDGGSDNSDEKEQRRGKKRPAGVLPGSGSSDGGDGAEEDFATCMKRQIAEKRRRLEGKSSGGDRKASADTGSTVETAGKSDAAATNGSASAATRAGAAAPAVAAAGGSATVAGGADDESDEEDLEKLRRNRREATAEKTAEYERLRAELRAKHSKARKILVGEERSKYDAEQQSHDMLTPLQQMRAKFKTRRQAQGSREDATLAKLAAFTQKIRTATSAIHRSGDGDSGRGGGDDGNGDGSGGADGTASETKAAEGYHGQVTEQPLYEGEDDDAGWFATKLKFRKHIDDKYRMGADGRAVDDYEVIDDRARGGGRSSGGGGGGRSGGGRGGGGDGGSGGGGERRNRAKEMAGKGWGKDRPGLSNRAR